VVRERERLRPPPAAVRPLPLAAVQTRQLAGVKVYWLGEEAEKPVYVVGKTEDGQWAGVKTNVVET
jgi:hypothetical protein